MKRKSFLALVLTILMLIAFCPVSANADGTDDSYPEIALNTEITVPAGRDWVVYRFIPEETENYIIRAYRGNGARVNLRDSSFNILNDDDHTDVWEKNDFWLLHHLKAGETYYFEVTRDDPEMSAFDVRIEVAPYTYVTFHANNEDACYWDEGSEYHPPLESTEMEVERDKPLRDWEVPYALDDTLCFWGWSTDPGAEEPDDEIIVSGSRMDLYAVWGSWKRFRDVTDKNLFYYDYVYWASRNSIVQGWDDGTFRPLESCNRAAVVTFLWKMAGSPEEKVTDMFSDLTRNKEFVKAISWAAENGILTGWDDGTFRPWQTCSRAAIVTFLWRYAGKPEPGTMAGFDDMTGNMEFNKAISWAQEAGITTGWEDNTFRPWKKCTRLAVVSFLSRYDGLSKV